ncbi:hypothetical protein [Limosilactobacillus fermentum]|uniref:hypothetical protein n=1 Tax=Limosilactobacillus fermentum TaxID=1613 RepID=UPI000CE2AFFE|nr:hypothetical protein [Limosilactobacillus fermentum]SNX31952.1 Zn finger protein [Limosilactobacillus fermentum]
MENFSTLEKWILWGTTIICAIIGLSVDGFLGFILLAVVAYFATKFALKKHDEKFPASLTPQEREAMKKEKEEKARIKAEKKAQAEAEAQAVIQQLQKAKQDRMQAKMKCPRCGSKNIQLAGKHRKGFSVGKAVGGTALTGGIGALTGFAGKQTKKSDWVCLDCGRSFTIK